MSARAVLFWVATFTSALCMGAVNAAESAPPVVVARAVGELPRRPVVEFVALHAKAARFDAASRPNLRELTARELIESLCGSVQDGYPQILSAVNPDLGEIDLNKPLQELAFAIEWPACLFAQSGEYQRLVFQARRNDTLTHIREVAVGDGRYIPVAIDKFFESSGYTVANAKALPVGLELPLPFVTAITALEPKGDADAFLLGLAEAGGDGIEARLANASPGDIIGPVKFAAGDVQGTKIPCSAGDGSRPYPFDAREIATAFRFTSQHSELPDRLTMVVADNGFFGVPCPDSDNCPKHNGSHLAASERFPRALFNYSAYKGENGLGPAHKPTRISTLNYWNLHPDGRLYRAADVDEDTGHGTHVAGLMLGGPEFVPFRDAFLDADGRSQWTLVVLNLSGGLPQLAVGSDETLSTLMQQVQGDRKIVNMSVAFRAAVDKNIPAVIRKVVARDEQTLFVVAAGNSGDKLDDESLEIYPARFGGGAFGSELNVVTVASVDGPVNGIQHLSTFSNRSTKYVDIAAPGCQIASWLNDEGPPVAVSGTSQAAPIVSFSAALLQMLWQVPAPQLKNRLLYSGDLLDRAQDRDRVFSRSKVNPAKALTFLWDRLTFEQDGERRTLLGTVNVLTGFRCDGQAGQTPLKAIRSVKRDGERFTTYKVNHAGLLELCPGQFDANARITFTAVKEVLNGDIVDPPQANVSLAVSDVVDVVMDQ